MEFAPRPQKKEIEPGLKEWQRSAILSLREPLAEIYRRYQSEIEQGKYGLILGDDVSGRIPALIFAEVIKDTYADRGYAPPLVRFVSGGRHTTHDLFESPEELERRMQTTEDLLRHFAKETERSGGKSGVLFVTEAIIVGDSMSSFLNGVKRADLDVDIAAVGVLDRGVKKVKEQHNVRIEAGQEGLPSIYGDRTITGLQKQRGAPVAHAAHTVHPFTNVNAPIRETREIAHQVAQQIRADVVEK